MHAKRIRWPFGKREENREGGERVEAPPLLPRCIKTRCSKKIRWFMTNVTLSTTRIRRVDQLAWYHPIEVSYVLGFLEMSKNENKKKKKAKRWKVKRKKKEKTKKIHDRSFYSVRRPGQPRYFPLLQFLCCFEFLFHTPRLKCNVGYFENAVCIWKSIVFSKRALIGFKIVKLRYRRRRKKKRGKKFGKIILRRYHVGRKCDFSMQFRS